ANVMRWEKRPRLFLRTSEFLWQEGHTAHATSEEALAETEKMLEVYRKIMTEDLALPVVEGVKSEGERFPGALETYTCETMVSDTKALQAGTSHFLGQNFAKAFNIQFQNKNEQMEYAWTTSWGVSTRMIGAVIMTHSDNDGLILPPHIAPTKAVIIPISKDESKIAELQEKAQELAARLNAALGGMYVKVDTQTHMRPADRFFYYLQKGVPLRLELGEKDAAAQSVRAVRRDTGEKFDLAWDALERSVPEVLEVIQKSLYEKACAFRDANTVEVGSYDELKAQLSKGGWVRAYFAGSKDDEKKIKEETGATVRCYPLADSALRGCCVYTGKENARLAIFAKSY
ncbi:MAG: His/Gly/Thr/Pro-type tRNA ligase C-terminal domain-containing protein, partial [Pyramidobacter sp.]|nr:His/Gly/Thr/Pro-type tRNA ligase C-terminal domain-containing protein [Pyramidobacter sp.]